MENRRRSRIVDRQFQFGLAWRFLLVITALFALGILLVFAPSVYVLATTKDLESLEPAAMEFLLLHKRIWPAAILSFAGLFAYTIFFSNRIAGPIYRINSVLRRMIDGEYPRKVAFRRKDCFGETAELLTALSAKLSGKEPKP
jgi:signal transduction histidine kinase